VCESDSYRVSTAAEPAFHGFWIVDDVVFVETVSGEERVTDPDQVAVYERLADRLWSAAVTGDDARAVLLSAGRQWARSER